MARVDYWGIAQAIQRVLQEETALQGVQVTIEDEGLFGAEATPWVGIYIEGRTAPPDMQVLAAGRRTRMLVRFALWCWYMALETEAAMRGRDDLVGKVEIALMRDRTFEGAVATAWLEGGELPSARLQQGSGFVSGAEIALICDVTARVD